MDNLTHVTIYTDGACILSPGPGGYAVILEYEGRRKELSGGFRYTTNNRMEVMAVITALEAVKISARLQCLATLNTWLRLSLKVG